MKKRFGKDFYYALRMTLPVMAGYVFLGMTFGLLAKSEGFAWWVPVLMSLVIYSGALEFAAVPLMGSFDPIGALLLGIMLSARHLFYGIPMLKKYEGTKMAKPFLIFGLTDETFSILSTAEPEDGVNPSKFYVLVTLLDYIYWVSGTLVGAILGTAINLNLEGLDFVLTALFVVLFIEQMKTKSGILSGIVGVAASAVSLIAFGKTYFIVISMAMIASVLFAGKKVIDRE